MKIKIVNFGSLNIDNSYKMPHFVRPGETLKSDLLEVNPGGKGLNQSIAIRRAGSEVYHAGLYGTNGEMLKDYLEDNMVKTDFMSFKDVIQGHATIQVDESGENCIILYGGSNTSLTNEDIDAIIDNLDSDDMLVLQNEINNLSYIVDKAFERNVRIVFNPAPMNEQALKVDLMKVDWLIVNEVEGMELTKETESEKVVEVLSKEYPKLNIILTLGADGSICRTDGKTYYQKAFKRDVIDTTGAGDTFIGYIVSGIVDNIEIEENLKIASMASSLSIGHAGAAPSIPLRKEVVNELKTYKEK